MNKPKLRIFFCFLVWLNLVSGSLMAQDGPPNIIFILLDDLGYSQVEAYARGLEESDCDPALLAHVAAQDSYTPAQAFKMVKRATPTLSRMADQGIRFNNAFANSNICAASRIGIATGILQNRWGIYRNIDAEAHGLKPHSHLAERLKEKGYATAHIGKWHIGTRDREMVQRYLAKEGVEDVESYTYYNLGKEYEHIRRELKKNGYEGSVIQRDHPLNNGFDYYFGYNMWESPFYNATNVWEGFEPAGLIKDYNTDVFTDKAMDFMKQSMAEGKPFYIQLHYHAVHSPLTPKAPEKYFDRFDSGSFILDNFYAHVYGVDENVRRMREFLAENGQDENTIFVFTSDNGGAVGFNSCLPGNAPYIGHKAMMYMGGFRVPLFFYWPDGIKKAHASDQLVTTLDILPTLIDIAGGSCPEGLDGKSLQPLFDNEDDHQLRDHLAIGGIHGRVWAFHRETAIYEENVSREIAPSGFIVANDRYILRYISETIPNLYTDCLDGIPANYGLFDYVQDPGERNNLVDTHPELVQELKDIWLRESSNYPPPAAWSIDKWEAIIHPE
jgi:uncharacterized sulfatase